MLTTGKYYRFILERELNNFKTRNPRFSLGAYSKLLDFDKGSLSKILAFKKNLSVKSAEKIVSALPIKDEEKRNFIYSVTAETNNTTVKNITKKIIPKAAESKEISGEDYKKIYNWYTVAILEMVTLEDFQATAEYIQGKINISKELIKASLTNLINLGLIYESENGWRKANYYVTSGDKDKTTDDNKRYIKSLIEKAKDSVDNVAFEERAHSTITMPFDKSKLKETRELIFTFMHGISEAQKIENCEDVYAMNVSLFPL